MDHQTAADFQEFVRTRWAGLVRTGYLLTGDRGHAEDLAQTALANAYVAWAKVRRSDHPDAYLRRILLNAHLGRFRRKRVREQLTDRVPEGAVHDDADRIDQRRMLFAALADLPRKQRAVVVLRYWEDLSEAEVAAALRCSVGTVKSQASKGLAKLRRHPGLTAPAAWRPEKNGVYVP